MVCMQRPTLRLLSMTVLCALSAGCPAPPAQPAAPPAPEPRPLLNLENLFRGGRLSELERRISEAPKEAERQAPDVVGLLLAATGRINDALPLLGKALEQTVPASGMCLPLLVAQMHVYQRGDTRAALETLGVRAEAAPCQAQPMAQAISSLRAQLVPLLGGPALEVVGPNSEQRLTVDRIAANAGYLVVRVIFDRERSGHFLLGTGFSDVVIDRQLLSALRLRAQEERPMPAGDVPGLAAGAEATAGLPTATVSHMRIGLFNLRNIPVLVADLSNLRELFRKLISREVRIDGLLPLQRLAPRGYIRLQQRGTEVLVSLNSAAAGPCRMQHPHRARLYQLGGLLFTEAALVGSPPLLMQVTLERRRTLLRHSALKYASRAPSIEPAMPDVARPAITEPEAPERIPEVDLLIGEAQFGLRKVPLLPSASPPSRPADHGTIGADVPAELDIMIDLGEGYFYLAPRDKVRCTT
ncbi:MAG: aspartyl protease family protein [Myxococcales bacterium]|nr:aspartyl protease family protein [Myxococcales bacterium]